MEEKPPFTNASARPGEPRLLDQVRSAIRRRHYSHRTEQAYTHWIKRFIYFHAKRHKTTDVRACEREGGRWTGTATPSRCLDKSRVWTNHTRSSMSGSYPWSWRGRYIALRPAILTRKGLGSFRKCDARQSAFQAISLKAPQGIPLMSSDISCLSPEAL